MRQKVILFSDSSVGKPLELFGANDGITADTGHNIVADGSAGVSNPHPTFPTCTEPFYFLTRAHGPMGKQTDRQTKPLIDYGVAWKWYFMKTKS